jgi:hypothetical protein
MSSYNGRLPTSQSITGPELRRQRKFAETILAIKNAIAATEYLKEHPEIMLPCDLAAIDCLVVSAEKTLLRLRA